MVLRVKSVRSLYYGNKYNKFPFCFCYKEENGQVHNSHASAKYYIIYHLIKYIIYVILFLIILYKLQRSVRNVSIFH